MLLEKENIKIFVYKDAIDMRAGFERLHSFCVHHMGAKMNEGNAYVFFGKNRSRMKLLFYDGSGLVVVAKRIERNKFMSLSDLLGRNEISTDELRLIFHGGVIHRPIFGKEADDVERQAVEESFLFENLLTTQRERLALPKGMMNLPSC